MSNELITVASYRYATKAEMVKELLAQAGVQAFVADAAMVTNDWFLGNAIGYVKLQVPEAQAEEALKILNENPLMLDAAPPEEDLDAPVKCLECGAMIADGDEKCPACGWSYEQEGDAE